MDLLAANRAAARAILDCRVVRRAAARLEGVGLACRGNRRASSSAARRKRRVRTQKGVFPSKHCPQTLIPLDVGGVAEHVDAAAALPHPFETEDSELPADAAEAAEWVASSLSQESAGYVRAERDNVCRILRLIKRDLLPINALLEPLAPDYVRAMPQRVDVALVHVLALATSSPDGEVALLFLFGGQAVGDVTPSGWWESKVDPATVDLSTLDHVAWREQAIAAAASASRRDPQLLWGLTMSECERGLMEGPWTAEELDTRFGCGAWRCMARFGVLQKNKVRPCDNARASLHNAGTSTFEKLGCDTPDFSAKAALCFYQLALELGCSMWELAGGTDDLADAYRHVPCSQPNFTVIVLIDPNTGEPAYFTMAGFPFGLKSAVLEFNRFPELMVAAARRLLGIVCTHFYDDYAVVEPAPVAAHAQQCLAALHEMVGFPFKKTKHVEASTVFTFLGVETDFRRAPDGVVSLAVRRERIDSIIADIDALLDEGFFPPSTAASLCGRLQFILSWVGGRLGRACMQPLFSPGADVVTPAVAASLRYLRDVLPELPAHVVQLQPALEPPALVFSDGAYEETGLEQGVGFLVAIPRPDAPARDPAAPPSGAELARHYDFYHGAAEVPEDLRRALLERRQQIGQVEIIGAITPYLSVPALAGRRVIHWIDNQSAAAALCKGYSGVPDSARLVHMFHAWAACSRASVWFEFVPTDQNVSDDPSRDMSLRDRVFRPLPGVCSCPVPVHFPSFRSLDEPGGWAREARSVVPMSD